MNKSRYSVIACCMLSSVLGTVHAFSVFVPEWEQQYDADRAVVSLTYSIALMSLTLAVLAGHRFYAVTKPGVLIAAVGCVSALALWLAGTGQSLASLYCFYGMLFGAANGFGYGYALQLAGQAVSSYRGLAMSLVTAFYAVGATVAPPLFAFLIEHGGNALALKVMAWVVLLVSLCAGVFAHVARTTYKSDAKISGQSLSGLLRHTRMLLWLGYGSSVMAGLMVISHAFGIAEWLGMGVGLSALAATVVAFGNMLGGFVAGFYADKSDNLNILRWLPITTAAGLALFIVLPPFWFSVFLACALVGFGYGASIAIYPVAVMEQFGPMAAPRVYGQIFTAWGLAGLVGPVVSGWLYDRTHSYQVALALAIIFSVVSSGIIWHLRKLGRKSL